MSAPLFELERVSAGGALWVSDGGWAWEERCWPAVHLAVQERWVHLYLAPAVRGFEFDAMLRTAASGPTGAPADLSWFDLDRAGLVPPGAVAHLLAPRGSGCRLAGWWEGDRLVAIAAPLDKPGSPYMTEHDRAAAFYTTSRPC